MHLKLILSKNAKKITLNNQYHPKVAKTHFVLTDQRLKTPGKKKPLHQNPSLTHMALH